eukprot:maker-scaffold634_size121673-snap-gene-0.20 protein:Tk06601 transcript:maker-scaffold634_size121673-snap-gene-0.20-mRNA-1 annotation:"tpr repeat protein"
MEIRWFLLSTALVVGVCHGESESIEQEFTQNTDYCKQSAEQVHANAEPSAKLNHFLLCISQKTEQELSQTQGQQAQELQDVSNALTKILYDPLFREDVSKLKQRRVRREAPQLDENILSALVNNPEALTLVLDYLKKNNKLPKTTLPPARRRVNNPGSQAYFRRPGQYFQRPPRQRRVKSRPTRPLPFQSHAPRFEAPQPPKDMPNNPMVKGNFDRDLEFFGPSDFKPERPYDLPGGDLQVYPWQVGYVPIPR